VLATTVLLLGGTIGFAGGASAAAKPKLIVSPALNLRNNTTVKVSGTGFKPGDTVYIVECLRVTKGQTGCNVPGLIPPNATVKANGTFSVVRIKVITGKIGNGKCGTTKANLNGCEVSAGNATGGDTASVPITFK
jgi:hypothetical protein